MLHLSNALVWVRKDANIAREKLLPTSFGCRSIVAYIQGEFRFFCAFYNLQQDLLIDATLI